MTHIKKNLFDAEGAPVFLVSACATCATCAALADASGRG
jgi:hypothetical protein